MRTGVIGDALYLVVSSFPMNEILVLDAPCRVYQYIPVRWRKSVKILRTPGSFVPAELVPQSQLRCPRRTSGKSCMYIAISRRCTYYVHKWRVEMKMTSFNLVCVLLHVPRLADGVRKRPFLLSRVLKAKELIIRKSSRAFPPIEGSSLTLNTSNNVRV